MAEQSLDEILSGEEPVEEPSEEESTEPETGEEEVEASVETEEEAEEEPPSSNKIDPEQFKGYLDEREKRQTLERENAELAKKLETLSEPPKQIDPIEDPEGFQADIDSRIRQAEFKIERKFMAKMHDDWEQAEAWINEQINADGVIKAKLAGSDQILEDAYSLWTQHKKLEELESFDPEAEKARIRAEVLAELKQEGVSEAEAKAQKLAEKEEALKPSLATVGDSGSESEIEESLDEIIGMDANNRKR